MAMPAWIPEAWNKLSEDNQKKAENILQVLLKELGEADVPKKTHIQYDVMKGKITIADNFDDPLTEFEEYM